MMRPTSRNGPFKLHDHEATLDGHMCPEGLKWMCLSHFSSVSITIKFSFYAEWYSPVAMDGVSWLREVTLVKYILLNTSGAIGTVSAVKITPRVQFCGVVGDSMTPICIASRLRGRSALGSYLGGLPFKFPGGQKTSSSGRVRDPCSRMRVAHELFGLHSWPRWRSFHRKLRVFCVTLIAKQTPE